MHNVQVCQNRRAAFGRLEFVVCLGLVALVLSIMPIFITHQKGLAQKLRCLGNMRQVGVAMHAYASNYGGGLPPLVADVEVTNHHNETGRMQMSWPILLLPAVDASSILKDIKQNAVFATGNSEEPTMLFPTSQNRWLPCFTCPLDTDSYQKEGGLSFVVNAGFICRDLYHGDPQQLHRLERLKWDGPSPLDESERAKLNAATGVFWRPSGHFQPSLDAISQGDGVTTTLMITENTQAGSWYETDTTKIAFGIPAASKHGNVLFGAGTFFESASNPLNTEFKGGGLTTAAPHDWRINCDPQAAVGTRPCPSANHFGSVNAIMCDGSGRVISERIDPHVYVKLVTSNGVQYGELPLTGASW